MVFGKLFWITAFFCVLFVAPVLIVITFGIMLALIAGGGA